MNEPSSENMAVASKLSGEAALAFKYLELLAGLYGHVFTERVYEQTKLDLHFCQMSILNDLGTMHTITEAHRITATDAKEIPSSVLGAKIEGLNKRIEFFHKKITIWTPLCRSIKVLAAFELKWQGLLSSLEEGGVDLKDRACELVNESKNRRSKLHAFKQEIIEKTNYLNSNYAVPISL